MTAAARRRCSCGKAATPGDAYCADCAVTPGPLDEDYLVAYARELQGPSDPNGSSPGRWERCPVCRHSWHGLRCEMSGCGCAVSGWSS